MSIDYEVGKEAKPNALRNFFGTEFMHNFKRNSLAILGIVIIIFSIVIALLGPYFVPQNPYDLYQLDVSNAYIPPVWMDDGDVHFPLGTDGQGRDILSSLVYGSRISLFIGIVGTLTASVIGVFLGLISGYYGGRIDNLIMRIADVQLSFPSMIIALFMMSLMGKGIDKLLIALTLVGWVVYARTVRGETLVERTKEYIEAARMIGLPNRMIIFKHLLPNVTTSIIVISTLRVGSLILTEATLSFLGVGVPITEPSLGLLVKNGFDVLFSGKWWVSMFPGLYIMFIVFGINLFGDFLRDEFNPRLK